MKRLLLSLLAALAAAPASAAALAYQRHVLSNGLVVLLYQDQTSPVVATRVWYNVGSKNEQPGHTGFAHLFEHYMFECTKHTKENAYFDNIFRQLGGEANADTTQDRTNYYSVVPANGLERVLWLESERMGFLSACLNKEYLDKQRGIVENEKRLDENQPYAANWDKLLAQTFTSPHPYGWPIIGSMLDLEAASIQDVREFHDRYYIPNNAVLAIAGPIDPAATLARVKFWFEGIKGGPTPPKPAVAPLAPLGGRRENTYTDVKAQAPMLVLAFPSPPKGKPGYDAMDALASVLGGGRGSRFARALRDNAQPAAVSVDAGMWPLYEESLLVITAIPADGVSLPQLEAAIFGEIAKIAKDGPRDAELARVKAGLRTAFYEALQNVEDVSDQLVEGEAIAHDPRYFLDGEPERVNALTSAEVQAAAKTLVSDNVSVVKALPAAPAGR